MIHKWIRLFFRKGHDRPRTGPEDAEVNQVDDPKPEPQAVSADTGHAPAIADTPPVAAGAQEPCPACGADVDLPADVELGEILHCAHCGAEVEVISRDPLRLDLFEEEEK